MTYKVSALKSRTVIFSYREAKGLGSTWGKDASSSLLGNLGTSLDMSLQEVQHRDDKQTPSPSQHRERGQLPEETGFVLSGTSVTEKGNQPTFFLLFGEGMHRY